MLSAWLVSLADRGGRVPVTVDEHVPADADSLHYHPKTLVAGVGCERGCDPAEVIGLIEAVLEEARLSPLSLAALATIDIKSDEPAMLRAATRAWACAGSHSCNERP